jgi:hypothetical protein
MNVSKERSSLPCKGHSSGTSFTLEHQGITVFSKRREMRKDKVSCPTRPVFITTNLHLLLNLKKAWSYDSSPRYVLMAPCAVTGIYRLLQVARAWLYYVCLSTVLPLSDAARNLTKCNSMPASTKSPCSSHNTKVRET